MQEIELKAIKMASTMRAIVRAIDRSTKTRARGLRQAEAAYKRELRELQREQKARIREQLALEKQQLAMLKEEFERKLENSKSMLAKRETKRKDIIKTYIKKNFK